MPEAKLTGHRKVHLGSLGQSSFWSVQGFFYRELTPYQGLFVLFSGTSRRLMASLADQCY